MLGTAPWIDNILNHLKNRPSVAGSEINHLLMEIYQSLEPIDPVPEDQIRMIWLEVPCGTIEDYGDPDEFIEEGIVDSLEEFEWEWRESYSQESKFYELTTSQHLEEKYLFINKELVFQFNDVYEPKKENEPDDENIILFLKWILAALKIEIETIHDESELNHSYLVKKLECQKGTKILNRQIYWDLFGPNAIRMN